jgi:hypothetical protein
MAASSHTVYSSNAVAAQQCTQQFSLTQQPGVDEEGSGEDPSVPGACGPALVVDKLQQTADEEEGSGDDAAGGEAAGAGQADAEQSGYGVNRFRRICK